MSGKRNTNWLLIGFEWSKPKLKKKKKKEEGCNCFERQALWIILTRAPKVFFYLSNLNWLVEKT